MLIQKMHVHRRCAMSIIRAACFTLILLITCSRANAAPDEIQVYIDDLNRVGGSGVDFHVNYVPTGDPDTDYPEQQSSVHRLRVTPEFSYGVSDHVELGVYLPLATYDRSGNFGVHGFKGRIKYIGSAPGGRWFWGGNLEVGYEDRALATNAGNAEAKLIGGVHAGKWLIATNVNADFAYWGRRPDPMQFDVESRVSREVAKGLQLGVETYNGTGDARHFGRFGISDQSTFAIADVDLGHDYAVNFGVGRGYGGNRDRLILKAIVSVPFGHRSRGETPKVGTPR